MEDLVPQTEAVALLCEVPLGKLHKLHGSLKVCGAKAANCLQLGGSSSSSSAAAGVIDPDVRTLAEHVVSRCTDDDGYISPTSMISFQQVTRDVMKAYLTNNASRLFGSHGSPEDPHDLSALIVTCLRGVHPYAHQVTEHERAVIDNLSHKRLQDIHSAFFGSYGTSVQPVARMKAKLCGDDTSSSNQSSATAAPPESAIDSDDSEVDDSHETDDEQEACESDGEDAPVGLIHPPCTQQWSGQFGVVWDKYLHGQPLSTNSKYKQALTALRKAQRKVDGYEAPLHGISDLTDVAEEELEGPIVRYIAEHGGRFKVGITGDPTRRYQWPNNVKQWKHMYVIFRGTPQEAQAWETVRKTDLSTHPNYDNSPYDHGNGSIAPHQDTMYGYIVTSEPILELPRESTSGGGPAKKKRKTKK